MTAGDRIRICRERVGITQTELGKACGVSKQAICNYEKGLTEDIPISRIKRIADALGVTAGYLTGWSKYGESEETEIGELVQCYISCDREGKNSILQIARSLAKTSAEKNNSLSADNANVQKDA